MKYTYYFIPKGTSVKPFTYQACRTPVLEMEDWNILRHSDSTIKTIQDWYFTEEDLLPLFEGHSSYCVKLSDVRTEGEYNGFFVFKMYVKKEA